MITFILLVLTTISFTTGYMDVKVVIKPEALNINPGVLTCYVKFPDFFGVPITLILVGHIQTSASAYLLRIAVAVF